MKTKILPVLFLIVIISVFLIINSNKRFFSNTDQTEIMPSVTQTENQPINEETSLVPTKNAVNNNSQPISSACREGDTVHQNVKDCRDDLECYSLTPVNERYCRLPDGNCKFFCTDK